MSQLDWIVLIVTLTAIISFGLVKSRTTKSLEGYFLSNRSMPWYLVLLSIMGTQASAITFLSAPGQAYTDGMRFVQYYFGLPLAMVVLCITFVPRFNQLKVFTAYAFLEQRFGKPTRLFTSFLFLLSRGLSTGISIYAPSIIIASLLGWDIFWTNLVMGGLLIVYTVNGGAKAVAYTQKIQLFIIFAGMLMAGCMIVHLLPEGIGFNEALKVTGATGKLNVITTGFTPKGFDFKDKYNLISGTIGGFFLALSYFGTDQSQVGRYLTAKNNTESKMGLLMNGLIKVPMQFCILLIGALLFTFYSFQKAPIYFDLASKQKALQTSYQSQLQEKEKQFVTVQQQYQRYVQRFASEELHTEKYKDSIGQANTQLQTLRTEYKQLLQKALHQSDANDTNYIFLRFVVDFLPKGLVGLLIAIIFMAAWGSIAAALNSLASCTMIDFHMHFRKAPSYPSNTTIEQSAKDYRLSKWYTFAWGIFCIITAEFATGMGSLIEAVNILGSLFYGVILGIFLVGFYMKAIQGRAILIAAIIGEIIVIGTFVADKLGYIGIGFLWLNVVGTLSVVLLSFAVQLVLNTAKKVTA